MGFWRVWLNYCDDNYLAPPDQARSGCAYAEYSLDNGPFVPFEDEVIISEVGLHTFQFRATDVAGNVEAPQSVSLGVTPPSDVDGDGVLDPIDNCETVANASQLDANGDGYGNTCDADLNNSGGLVNVADLALFRAAFGTSNADADLNGSGGIVNFADLAIFRSLFGKAPGPSGLVP